VKKIRNLSPLPWPAPHFIWLARPEAISRIEPPSRVTAFIVPPSELAVHGDDEFHNFRILPKTPDDPSRMDEIPFIQNRNDDGKIFLVNG